MELPNYRFPSARSVGQLIWEKARDFLQKAFTIIFVATVLIWFLQTFDARLNVAATPDASLLAGIGSFIAPIFKPLGFGDWRVSTALITVKRELGGAKAAAGVVLMQCAIAWGVAFVVHCVGSLIGFV